MSKRYWRLRVEDILESLDKIENYLGQMSFEDFAKAGMTVDAVARNLEVVGEASRHIPEELRDQYRQINWKNIIGLRNRIVHEYFGVDLHIVWQIVKNELLPLKNSLKEILEQEKDR